MISRVTATFIGQDGSCGYRNGKEYLLKIHFDSNQRYKSHITIEDMEGTASYCDYESIHSFLRNWDNIKNVKP